MKINAIGYSSKALMTIVISCLGFGLWGQSLIDETLRTGSLPTGWTAVNVAFETGAGGYANLSGNTAVLTTPVFDASAFASIDLDFSVAKFGTGDNGPLTIEYSIDGGSNWVTQGNSTTPTGSTYQPNSISIAAASATMQVRFTTANSPSAKRLRDAVIEGVGTAGTPAISFNVANVSNLDYQFGSGPSTAQSYEVSGSNLVGSGNISISAPTNFEVSLDNTSFGPSESLPFASGQITGQPVTVYVRMVSSLAVNTYNGNIEHTGGGATQTDLAVSGDVTSPPPSISTLGQAGAYFEDFQNFVSAATLPNGWLIDANGSATNKLDYSPWAIGGNNNTGVKYSTASANVLGYQHTSTTGIATFRLTILNQSGSTINALQVSYLGKVARPTEGRSPAFEVQVAGITYSALAYSTSGGVDENVTAVISGLSIANNQVFEIIWSSDRDNTGSNNSKQIGLTNVEVLIPQLATVTIEDLGNQILAGNVPQGAADHVLHQTEVVAVQNPALVTSVSFELDGTYDVADIDNLKLRYSTNATLDPADPTLGTVTSIPSTGNNVIFSGLSQSIAESATGYFYLTTDVDFNANIGNTIAAKAPIFNFATANNNNQGTNTSSDGGVQSIIASAATLELRSANPMTAPTNLPQGFDNVVIGAFSLEVSDANAALTEIEIEFDGNFDDTDIDAIALYFTFGSSFSTDTLLQLNTGVTGAGTFVFDGFSQGILEGQTGNFYLAAFVSCSARVGRELSVQALSPGDFSFSGAANVSGAASASGTHTVTPTTPDNVDNLQVSAGNQELVVSWTKPTGCLDEILVVVSENAANTGIPTGTSFTADPAFGGNGDALGNGTVVYFASGTDVTITGLTNNETYYVKVFANNAGNWSSGVEENAIPVEICFSESFSNVPAGSSTSYIVRNWTGDSGLDIDATDSRSDQLISGSPSVLIRNGRLRIQNITDGVGAITITTQRQFTTGGSGVLTIALDGTIAGTVPYSGVPQTTTIVLGFPGSFDSLTISTPGNGDRISITNLQWLCEEDGDFTWDGTQWQPQTPAGNSTNNTVINIRGRGANSPTLPANSNVIAKKLIVNPGKDLIVGPGARLSITDSIINGGKIILEANATDGPAHLIHNTHSSGTVEAYQHLTGPLPGTDNKWVHMGAAAEVPLSSVGQAPSVMNATSVFLWNANLANWESVNPAVNSFQPGKGYAIFAGTNAFGSFLSSLPGNISFEGEVTRGDQDVTVNIGYNDGQSSNPNFGAGDPLVATEGWNFLSNPWPAAYDLNGPNAHTGVTFYQYGNGQYQAYLPGVTAVSNSNNLVPPMGGFWIQNTGNSLNSFTFDRANRISASGTVLKRGGGQGIAEAYIDLQARIAGSGLTESTLIIFSHRGNEAFLRSEDAIKRRNDYGIPNMFTRADGLDCSIQSLPELDQNYRLPLYFDPSGANAVVELGLDRSKLNDGLQVFLEDKQQNAFVLLSENDYHFVANSSSQIDRFVLHFTYDQTVNVESFKNATSINAWVFKGEIFLKNPEAQHVRVQIVDVTGRVLFTQLTCEKDQIIPISNSLSAGVYLLKVDAGGKQVRTVKFLNQ